MKNRIHATEEEDVSDLEWFLVPAGNIWEMWKDDSRLTWIPGRIYPSGADTYHTYVYDRKGNVLAWDVFLEFNKAQRWAEKITEASSKGRE